MRRAASALFVLALACGDKSAAPTPPPVATQPPVDGGSASVAPPVTDAGTPDAGTPDAGTPDAGPPPGPLGHGEFIQSSPSVSTSLGRLYVGVASSAHCDEVAGRVAAVDLASGAVQQTN